MRTRCGKKHDRCNGVWSPVFGVLATSSSRPCDVLTVFLPRPHDVLDGAEKKVIPFAPKGASLPGMSKPKPQIAVNLEKAGPPGRSALFQWLRKEYAHLARTLNGPSPNWVKLAAEAEQAGQLGTNGKAQSPGALRKMWLRVRRDVEREEAAKLERRLARKPPNRSPQQATGRHQVTAVAPRIPPPAMAPEPAHFPLPPGSGPAPVRRTPTPTPKSKLKLEDLPPHVRAEFEKLDRGLAEFDRKRFGW